jgi:hypothetical protein
MEKVLGIGGFFFRSTTTKDLATWHDETQSAKVAAKGFL